MVCFLRKNFLAAAEFIQQVHQTVSQKISYTNKSTFPNNIQIYDTLSPR
jgi:hypothetical protein